MPTIPVKRTHVGPIAIAGGVRLNVDPVQLESNRAAFSEDWVHRRGKLTLRPGLTEHRSFSGTVGATERQHRWNGLHRIQFDDGSDYLCALNQTDFFTDDGSNWVDRTGTSAAITSGGDTFPWDITFGIDDAGTNGFGGTGTVFATNGSNRVIYWNPSDNADAYLLDSPRGAATFSYSGGPASTFIAKYCAVYNGRLILAHNIEDGTTHELRMRASAVNEFLQFDTTANAQVVDHAETPGAIVGLKAYAGRLYILKEDSIIVGHEPSQSTGTLIYPTQLPQGVLSGRGWAQITPFDAIFPSTDNIHRIRGTGIEPIGDDITQDFFDTIDLSKRDLIVAEADPPRQVYRLWVVEKGEDYPKLAYCFNWAEGLWWKERWTTEIHSATVVDFGGGTTIADLTSAISTYTNTIAEWGSTASTAKVVVGTVYDPASTPDDNRIHEFADQCFDEAANNGTEMNVDIVPQWRSKLFRLSSDGFATLYSVIVHYTSTVDTNLTVAVSTNKGDSFDTSIEQSASSGVNKRLIFNLRTTGLFHQLQIGSSAPQGCTSNPIEIHTVEAVFMPRRPVR